MSGARIGVTGASGQLGRGIVEILVERGHPVTGLTRTPRALQRFAGHGVEARAADFDRPGELAAAFARIDRLLVVPTSDLAPGARKRQHLAAIDAAVAAGVRHVVYLSAIGARPGPNVPDSDFFTELAIYRAGERAGLLWTILRMGLYSENLLATGELSSAVRTGRYVSPPAAPIAYVTRADVAAAAAGVIARDGDRHGHAIHHLTGPEAVTPEAIATLLSHVTGRSIPHVALAPAENRRKLARMPPEVAELLLDLAASSEAGTFDMVTGDVARLAGRPAQPLAAFLQARVGGTEP
jgi:NAD(P)H dehydrogenase (quinone)